MRRKQLYSLYKLTKPHPQSVKDQVECISDMCFPKDKAVMVFQTAMLHYACKGERVELRVVRPADMLGMNLIG